EHAEFHAALVGGSDAEVGFRRQEFHALPGRLQVVGLDPRRVVADRNLQIATHGIDGGDGWIGSETGMRAEVQLHAGKEADGGGPEELHARPAERYAIGFEDQAGEKAPGGVGGGRRVWTGFFWGGGVVGVAV